jgi:putative tricarboxylic transport membrane protein
MLSSLPGMTVMTVNNRGGGGGVVALTYMTQHPGDAHLLSNLSTSILTNHLVGTTKLSFRDVTPLNIVMREYIVATVRPDSALANAQDLIARIRKDPGSVSFAFATARGNQNHIVIGMLARAAGVDPKALKTVVFPSGAAGLTAVIGGHVDVLVGTPGTALTQADSGKARIIGVSAPTRQSGRLAAVPTFRDQGIDAVYYAWRGFLAPKGITPAQIAFWEQAFEKITQAESWKQDLERNAWAEDLRGAAETRKHLEEENDLLGRMLVDLGVIQR